MKALLAKPVLRVLRDGVDREVMELAELVLDTLRRVVGYEPEPGTLRVAERRIAAVLLLRGERYQLSISIGSYGLLRRWRGAVVRQAMQQVDKPQEDVLSRQYPTFFAEELTVAELHPSPVRTMYIRLPRPLGTDILVVDRLYGDTRGTAHKGYSRVLLLGKDITVRDFLDVLPRAFSPIALSNVAQERSGGGSRR
ncbi:MAG: hypothetical protein QXP81_09685 [Nitrososphaerota archaeon]